MTKQTKKPTCQEISNGQKNISWLSKDKQVVIKMNKDKSIVGRENLQGGTLK